jgi:hypothetical protein
MGLQEALDTAYDLQRKYPGEQRVNFLIGFLLDVREARMTLKQLQVAVLDEIDTILKEPVVDPEEVRQIIIKLFAEAHVKTP